MRMKIPIAHHTLPLMDRRQEANEVGSRRGQPADVAEIAIHLQSEEERAALIAPVLRSEVVGKKPMKRSHRSRVLHALVEEMKSTPLPSGSPNFTREELHERS